MSIEDAKQASNMDKKWFGKYGISPDEIMEILVRNPENTLALVGKNTLQGFALFEVVEAGMPKDYIGEANYYGKILFIQQFTTSTNYQKNNSRYDTVLLTAVEQKAKSLKCTEVWEALSIDHPYKKENNIKFDAFGFYEQHGYVVEKNNPLTWQPGKDISIPCYVFRKILIDR